MFSVIGHSLCSNGATAPSRSSKSSLDDNVAAETGLEGFEISPETETLHIIVYKIIYYRIPDWSGFVSYLCWRLGIPVHFPDQHCQCHSGWTARTYELDDGLYLQKQHITTLFSLKLQYRPNYNNCNNKNKDLHAARRGF